MLLMKYENILLEQPDSGVYLVTVNRPKVLNALNAATIDELERAVAQVAADDAARALLVTGAGNRAFVAGADIAEMRNYTPAEARAFSTRGMSVMHALASLPIPAIALVNGYALGGGCELALACDWILAADNAVFGQPEVNLGIPPGFGGTQRLARRIGTARALEMLTTARQLDADEALRIGLVNHVYPSADLRAKGIETGRAISTKGPRAVRLAKEAARRGADLDVVNGCALESTLFALAFASAEQQEGMRAFLEKRPPQFTSR